MDTVSPGFPLARITRPAASLLALSFVVLCLLVALGPSLAAALPQASDEPLLGPFRWYAARGVA